MGIRGLYTFILKNLSDCVETAELCGRTVFVDGDGFVQWLCERNFMNLRFSDLQRVEANLRSESFSKFRASLEGLMECNEVVFVFDVSGVYYELKKEKKQSRKRRRHIGKDIVKQHGHFYHEHPRKHYDLSNAKFDAYKNTDAASYLNKQVKDRLKCDLRSLGVCIHEACDAEADVVLARLHRETENSCILGNDTDFVIHPGITEYFILDKTFHISSGKRWDVPQIVRRLKDHWRICSDKDWLLAIQSCGSDYVPHSTIKALRHLLPCKPRDISWIEHTMSQTQLVEILHTLRFIRMKHAANIYDPHGTPPSLVKSL